MSREVSHLRRNGRQLDLPSSAVGCSGEAAYVSMRVILVYIERSKTKAQKNMRCRIFGFQHTLRLLRLLYCLFAHRLCHRSYIGGSSRSYFYRWYIYRLLGVRGGRSYSLCFAFGFRAERIERRLFLDGLRSAIALFFLVVQMGLVRARLRFILIQVSLPFAN